MKTAIVLLSTGGWIWTGLVALAGVAAWYARRGAGGRAAPAASD